jgi:hypothetical protein
MSIAVPALLPGSAGDEVAVEIIDRVAVQPGARGAAGSARHRIGSPEREGVGER